MLKVDRRVGSIDLAPMIRAHLPLVKVAVGTLKFGDVAFTGLGPDDRYIRIGVEVKTVGDLVQSMTSARLQGHQAVGMLDSYELNWIIVEGPFRPGHRSGMLEVPRGGKQWGSAHTAITYRQLDTFMVAMESAGFRYRRTWSREETALVIADLYRFWSKPWHEHKTFHTFDNSRAFVGMRRPNQCEVTAASLPGVGWDRAQAVARKFRTVENLVVATEGDIASVPGIGKVTAGKVWRALRGLHG